MTRTSRKDQEPGRGASCAGTGEGARLGGGVPGGISAACVPEVIPSVPEAMAPEPTALEPLTPAVPSDPEASATLPVVSGVGIAAILTGAWLPVSGAGTFWQPARNAEVAIAIAAVVTKADLECARFILFLNVSSLLPGWLGE